MTNQCSKGAMRAADRINGHLVQHRPYKEPVPNGLVLSNQQIAAIIDDEMGAPYRLLIACKRLLEVGSGNDGKAEFAREYAKNVIDSIENRKSVLVKKDPVVQALADALKAFMQLDWSKPQDAIQHNLAIAKQAETALDAAKKAGLIE